MPDSHILHYDFQSLKNLTFRYFYTIFLCCILCDEHLVSGYVLLKLPFATPFANLIMNMRTSSFLCFQRPCYGSCKNLLCVIIACVLLLFCSACGNKNGGIIPPNETAVMARDTATVILTKWQNDAPAALSFTYDHGWSGNSANAWEQDVERLLVDSALVMDFDWTPHYMNDNIIRYGRDSLKPRGYSFFGHGYYHINTDALTEDSARINFIRCKESMLESGITPIAYAYPGGYGYDAKTRRACRDAGFLSGRLFSMMQHPYIMPDSANAPHDWYALPSVPMFSAQHHANNPLLRATPYAAFVHNTEELIPYLDTALQRASWLILTYHGINTTGNGTYSPEDFKKDIAAAKARPFWCASMNAVTLYARERAATRIETRFERNPDNTLAKMHVLANDFLDDVLYNIPLTMHVTVPLSWQGRILHASQNGANCTVRVLNQTQVLISVLPNQYSCVIQVK